MSPRVSVAAVLLLLLSSVSKVFAEDGEVALETDDGISQGLEIIGDAVICSQENNAECR